MISFRYGFNLVLYYNYEILDLKNLVNFKSDEINNLFCGNKPELLHFEDLYENILPAHGFTK